MNNTSFEDSTRSAISNNPEIFGKLVSLSFLVFGIVAVIGAFKDWDWLYKPDDEYHNRWTIGQISRYLGRRPARVLGGLCGILLIIAGAVWSYTAFLGQ